MTNLTVIQTARNIRISKKSMSAFPENVVIAIKNIQYFHPNIKSFNFSIVTEDFKFYSGEGYEFDVIIGDNQASIEMVNESTVGSNGVSYSIGSEFKCSVGSFVLEVSYYTKYFLHVYNVQPKQIK